MALGELANRGDRRDTSSLFQVEQVDDRAASGVASHLWKYMVVERVGPAPVGVKQDVAVGGSREDVVGKVLFTQ